MAQITVIYKDFEEMKAVARELLKDELQTAYPVQHMAAPEEVAQPEVVSVPAGAPFPTAQVAPAPTAQPVTVAVPAPPVMPTTVPTAPAAVYSRDDLARAAVGLMDQGKQAELQALLMRYGVQALPQLPPEQYGAFATELRGMGAQI